MCDAADIEEKIINQILSGGGGCRLIFNEYEFKNEKKFLCKIAVKYALNCLDGIEFSFLK